MPKKVSTSANGNVNILWDAEINGKVRHNRPDTVPCCYERKQKDQQVSGTARESMN